MSSELTVQLLRSNIIKLIKREIEDPTSPLYIQFQTLISEIAQDAIDMDNVENDINWDETSELFGEFTTETNEEPTTFGLRRGPEHPTVSVKCFDKLLHTGEEFIIFESITSDEQSVCVVNLPFEQELPFTSDELIKIYSSKFNWTYKLQNGTAAAVKPNTLIYIKSEDLHNAEIKIII